jgi:large subunit ribosomal protein L25
MSQDVQLAAEERQALGKRAIAKLREQGKVPAIIQEHGKDSINLLIDNVAMLKAYEHAGKSQPIDLTVGSSKKLALIKELQFVPLKPVVQHVVFQALKQNEAVDAEVPIHITGEIPAEANRHVLLKTLETVAIRALPRDLPEALEVSGESLVEIDDRLTIRDIKLPEGVELVELLANAEDEEKQEEFLDQPIVLVKNAEIVESDEGEEVPEGESEADQVDSEHGGDSPEGDQDAEDQPGGKKAFEDKGE